MSTSYTIACAQCGGHLAGFAVRDPMAAAAACAQAPLLVHAYRVTADLVFGGRADLDWLAAHADHGLYVVSSHALPGADVVELDPRTVIDPPAYVPSRVRVPSPRCGQ